MADRNGFVDAWVTEQSTALETLRQQHAVRETDLTSRLASNHREITRLYHVIHELNKWGRASVARVEILTKQLSAIQQSSSWRLTRPLREVAWTISWVAERIRRLPRAVVHRSAALVRRKTPKFYERIAVNPLARHFYSVFLLPTAVSHHSLVQSPSPAVEHVTEGSALNCQFPDNAASPTLVSLTIAMSRWSLGKRIHA
jgi:hypothetical protein